MTPAPHTPHCDPETLAAFAEGRSSGAAADEVEAHLDTCDECRRDLALAMQAVEEGGANVVRPRRWTAWLGGVAAAVALLVLIAVIGNARRHGPIDRLVALSPQSARVVEPRLTGGFAWAPYHGTERSEGPHGADPERMKLAGAAGDLVERAQRDGSAQAQHDAGVALLLTQNPDEAIARLESAARANPSARTWSDLAAARYAAASDMGRAALYPRALAAADAALGLDPDLPEALFNRALILGRMGLIAEARAAWTRYLLVDPSSKWADDARTYLSELPAVTKGGRFEHDRPLLENAAARGDAETVRRLLAGHAAHVRALAEAEYLGRWGDALRQNKGAEAERWLAVARTIAPEIEGALGDSLLRDAVKAIDDASPARRGALADAHAAYRAGRIAYSRHLLDDALRDLTHAAARFEEGGSPMSLAARLYAASVQQLKNDAPAGAALERLLADVDAHPGYRALRANVRWETGRARIFDYNWSGAAPLLTEGAALFRQGGDRANEAAMESLLAYCQAAQGRGDASWSSRIRSLRVLSAEGTPGRFGAALAGAIRAERLAGHDDAALALARLPQPAAGDAEQLVIVLDALQFSAMLQSAAGDVDGARRTTKRAATLAQSVSDPAVRARRLADIDVATAAELAVSNPKAALAPLERAMAFYRRSAFPFALPEPLLLHARCARRTGSVAVAMADLDEGMAIVERHRSPADGIAEGGILDADRALFQEAIRLALDRGDDAAAFAVAERARGAAITVPELQKRLAGGETAVLEISLLPDEIVLFAITAREFRVARRHCDSAALPALAEAGLSERGTTAAAALYDRLVRPVADVLASARTVIVVPDPQLECVPFAALYDRQAARFLIERGGVAIASSAASLQRDAAATNASVATIALPAGEPRGMRALPEAGEELAEVAALYPRAEVISAGGATLAALRDCAASASVVHIAGHTERQPVGGEAALLLVSPDGTTLERASSRVIAALPAPRAHVIVLAACETLRPPASAETHAPSLGAAFVAAGTPDVIGTLMPISDRDARRLFRALHRRLAAGESASEALRAAQVAAIHEEKNGSAVQAWKSLALATCRIASGERRRRS